MAVLLIKLRVIMVVSKFYLLCDRRRRLLALSVFLLFMYSFHSMWYVHNSVLEVPRRRPIPESVWFKPTGPAFNMSLLNETADMSTLVDLKNFRFVINNRRCDGEDDVFIIIFVHSAPKNVVKRQAIRSTWGKEENLAYDPMRIVFLMGEVQDKVTQQAIEEENAKYHDIIQGSFLDSYRNLTYKHVMGLKWVTYFCRQAKYVFKTDDDIFVDIFQLTNYLKANFGLSAPANLMVCFLIVNPFVKRSQRSKWRVSFAEYPEKYYPPYCAGFGIIMSPDVVFRLYLHSPHVPFFWVDDVHVSGTLAKKAGITHVDITHKLSITSDEIDDWLKADVLSRPVLFGHPDSSVETIYALWNKTLQYYRWIKLVQR